MATFNHAYSLGFSISESPYEDGMDAVKEEAAKILQRMQQRVDELRNDPRQLIEALECWDTFEEDTEDLYYVRGSV